ncbi:CocE/NonD family hydrolase [Halocatena salina]|uniref:Alpha/beta hydrolase n=1 Tax=Halocatena salina TaxID=2934340 RepID=A0A8U0A445_9EURY|nr:CocE/NonD family hydrolase [Halocatena salina]UPM43981.1 alpha/beta hydrolase [Halocatena salina]
MSHGNSYDVPHRAWTRRTFLTVVGGTALAAAGGTAAAGGDDFTTTDITIDSFDGTEIASTLYEPGDGSNDHPAMLLTHGYGGNRETVRSRAEMYARNGYVTLAYDSRGFGESGGWVGVNGPKEVKDAQTLITWLANRKNVRTDGPDDPRIGIDGTSYGGGIQLNTAVAEALGDGVAESDDRLDALVPRWAWHDLTHSLAPNGVIKRNWALLLTLAGAGGSHLTGNDALDFIEGQSPKLYEILIEGLVENELSADATAYFDARSPSGDLGTITAPTLFIHGWHDTLFTPTELVRNADGLETNHRLVLTDGGHSLEAVTEADQERFLNAMAREWIDTHLRGDGQSDLPPVTFYERQSGTWQTADGVPPSHAAIRTLSVTAATDEKTTWVTNSVLPTSTSQLVPANTDAPGTSAAFDFSITESVELMGAPTLQLAVEPAGPETRLFAKLYHIDEDEQLIDNQVTPLLVEEAGITTTEIEMVPFQRRLEPGDTLRLTVSTTDAAFQSSRISVGATIHHSERYPSTLDVPVID